MTRTPSGVAKFVLTAVCWLFPNRTVIVNGWLSTAPISVTPLMMRVTPRWSVESGLPSTNANALLPASMAGLPGRRVIVSVGPP